MAAVQVACLVFGKAVLMVEHLVGWKDFRLVALSAVDSVVVSVYLLVADWAAELVVYLDNEKAVE